MFENMNTSEIIEAMFAYFGGDIKKKFIYEQFLSKHDTEFVKNRIEHLIENWKPSYGEKMPSIAEIIQGGTEENNAQIELAWQEYIRNRNNHLVYRTIPDWVYTVRELLGGNVLSEDATDEDLIWQKKEFTKIFPNIKNGSIALRKDPSQYIQIGGSTMLIDKHIEKIVAITT